MKKFLIILIIIFICGVLSADLCFAQIKDSNIILGKEFYVQYAKAKHVFKDILWNVVYERVKLLGLVFLFCVTPLKDKLSGVLLIIFSFAWGFFLMTCVIELGAVGIVVGLASVIPHGILYAIAIGLLLGKGKSRRYHIRNQIAVEVGSYIFMILLFITACILESLVGVHFIPWVIRLSLV